MPRQLVGEIALSRIRFQPGQDVPDSGEHPAHGDDCFLVPTAGLDPAVAFLTFEVLVIFDDGIRDLNQERLQIAASTGNTGGFHFLVALVVTRATASSGNQVLCGEKYRHIHANLRDESDSRQQCGREIRNCADQLQLVGIGLCKPKDLSFDMLAVFIELVDVQQAFLELGACSRDTAPSTAA